MSTDYSRLKRKLNALPEPLQTTMQEHGVLDDFYQRPAYQQNDYIAWIERAKKPETREKRIQQMLDELEQGGVYMKMKHAASIKK